MTKQLVAPVPHPIAQLVPVYRLTNPVKFSCKYCELYQIKIVLRTDVNNIKTNSSLLKLLQFL